MKGSLCISQGKNIQVNDKNKGKYTSSNNWNEL